MLGTLMSRWAREDGQGTSEYALMIALIAIVLIGALAIFGEDLYAMFEDMIAEITNQF